MDTTPVSVTYDLAGTGWAECIVELDGHRAHLSASYLSDALGELLRAVVNLLKGADEQTVSFYEESGEFRWRLLRLDSDDFKSALSSSRAYGEASLMKLVSRSWMSFADFCHLQRPWPQQLSAVLDEHGLGWLS